MNLNGRVRALEDSPSEQVAKWADRVERRVRDGDKEVVEAMQRFDRATTWGEREVIAAELLRLVE